MGNLRFNNGLHASPGIYGRFTDISTDNIIEAGRKLLKSTGGNTASGGGGGGVNPGPDPDIDYSKEYLTITALEDTNFYFGAMEAEEYTEEMEKTFYYSLNSKTNWISAKTSLFFEDESGETPTVIPEPIVYLHKGDVLYIKGNNSRYSYFSMDEEETGDTQYMNAIMLFPTKYCDTMEHLEIYIMSSHYGVSLGTCVNISGNIMSLIYGDDFIDKTELTEENTSCFAYLFYMNPGINDVSHLILPATTLSNACYAGMFAYNSNILIAPELPTTTLVEGCYGEMFAGCTSLNYVKCLATDISAKDCVEGMLTINSMVMQVPKVGVFIKNPDMHDWIVETSGETETTIPEGWIVCDGPSEITNTTVLNPAGYVTVTSQSDYTYISAPSIETRRFYISKNKKDWCELQDGVIYKIDKNSNMYLCGMTGSIDPEQMTSQTTFVMSGKVSLSGNINSMWNYSDLNANLIDYCGACLFSLNSSIQSISGLTFPATTLATHCYGYMFAGCSNITSAPELPATTLAEGCYALMFYGCTSLTTAPALPATTLVEGCYSTMFAYCVILTSITCLATDISAEGCTSSWTVALGSDMIPGLETGTFHCPSNMVEVWRAQDEENGVPASWEYVTV